MITSALTLGKVATLANVGLIAACYIFLGSHSLTEIATLASSPASPRSSPRCCWSPTSPPCSRPTSATACSSAKLLSETDELTGLFNTRGFAIAANRLFGQAQRYGRPASVLMIDCDNLKTVNDTHGHDAGNRLLRQVANAVQVELRATDVPARYGGDEFIVLLPETPPKGAVDVAERIRLAIAARPLAINGENVVASVSIGIASYPGGRPHPRRARRARRPRAVPGEAGRPQPGRALQPGASLLER